MAYVFVLKGLSNVAGIFPRFSHIASGGFGEVAMGGDCGRERSGEYNSVESLWTLSG